MFVLINVQVLVLVQLRRHFQTSGFLWLFVTHINDVAINYS